MTSLTLTRAGRFLQGGGQTLALVDGYPYFGTARSFWVLKPRWPFHRRPRTQALVTEYLDTRTRPYVRWLRDVEATLDTLRARHQELHGQMVDEIEIAAELVDQDPYVVRQLLERGCFRTAGGLVELSEGVPRASPGGFSRAGPYAVVSLEGRQGIALLDVSNPAAPRQLDRLDEGYEIHGVLLERPDRIFASAREPAGSTGLLVLRIVTSGGTPRLKPVHFEPIPRLHGERLEVYRAGRVKHGFLMSGAEYLFVAGKRGVRVFNPATLEEHADVAWTLPDGDAATDLALAGLQGEDYLSPFLLYISTERHGLYGLEYTSRTAPPREVFRYARIPSSLGEVEGTRLGARAPGRYPRLIHRGGSLYALQGLSPAFIARFDAPAGVFLEGDQDPPGLQVMRPRQEGLGDALSLELDAQGGLFVVGEGGVLAASTFQAGEAHTLRRLPPDGHWLDRVLVASQSFRSHDPGEHQVAFLVERAGGIAVVKVDTPSRPELLEILTPAECQAACVHGDTLYAFCMSGEGEQGVRRLLVYAWSDEARRYTLRNPSCIPESPLRQQEAQKSAAVVAERDGKVALYVAPANGLGLLVYDVTTPGAPSQQALLPRAPEVASERSPDMEARGLALHSHLEHGLLLFVSDNAESREGFGAGAFSSSRRGLLLFKLDDLLQPRAWCRFQVEARGVGDLAIATLAGRPFLFQALAGGRLATLDLSTLSPEDRILRVAPISGPVDDDDTFPSVAVDAELRLAVTTSEHPGLLRFYDVSAPAAPVHLHDLALAGQPRSVQFHRGRLYVASNRDGLVILDVGRA
jgi:hypothetical protein